MNNREIKFRIWDTQDKNFFFASLAEMFDTDYVGMPSENFNFQQYTGLKDKNGREIYEGDIIIFMGRWDDKGNVLESDYQKYTVNWFMGGLWAMTIKKSCRSFHTHNEMLGVGHTDSEVIGNIFETPELLK